MMDFVFYSSAFFSCRQIGPEKITNTKKWHEKLYMATKVYNVWRKRWILVLYKQIETVAVVLINIYGDSMFPLSLIMYVYLTFLQVHTNMSYRRLGCRRCRCLSAWHESRNQQKQRLIRITVVASFLLYFVTLFFCSRS